MFFFHASLDLSFLFLTLDRGYRLGRFGCISLLVFIDTLRGISNVAIQTIPCAKQAQSLHHPHFTRTEMNAFTHFS
jgi:hypothetical protein